MNANAVLEKNMVMCVESLIAEAGTESVAGDASRLDGDRLRAARHVPVGDRLTGQAGGVCPVIISVTSTTFPSRISRTRSI